MLHRPKTLSDAEQLAERADSAYYSTSLPQRGPRGDGSGPMDLGSMGQGGYSGENDQKSRRQRLCFNCGKPGHIARFCKSKKKGTGQDFGHTDQG